MCGRIAWHTSQARACARASACAAVLFCALWRFTAACPAGKLWHFCPCTSVRTAAAPTASAQACPRGSATPALASAGRGGPLRVEGQPPRGAAQQRDLAAAHAAERGLEGRQGLARAEDREGGAAPTAAARPRVVEQHRAALAPGHQPERAVVGHRRPAVRRARRRARALALAQRHHLQPLPRPTALRPRLSQSSARVRGAAPRAGSKLWGAAAEGRRAA